jgi:hypothetical protein
MTVGQKVVDIEIAFYKIILNDLKKIYNFPMKFIENCCYIITISECARTKQMSSSEAFY